MTGINSHRVVVGVDGSTGAMAAVDLAAAEAVARGVALHIVHAYLPVTYYAPYTVPYPASYTDDLNASHRAIVTAAIEQVHASHPTLPVHTHIAAGGGATVLIEASRTAELVVVGSRGRGGFLGLLAGSVSTQVAEHAVCPVLVARTGDGETRPPAERHVVVGVDGSASCGAAVGFAFAEADRRGVELVAVHVWSHLPVTELTADAPISYNYPQAKEDAGRVIAESIAGWGEKYPDVRVRSAPILAEDAAAELIRASERAEVVVVGSRGRGELASALLGSVGHSLVRHAHCPVAVVH